MSAFLDDPAELDESMEVALGRRAPFTQLGDWVLLSGIDPAAHTLYWGLSAHINVTREDTEVWPGLATLARFLCVKKPEQAAAYMLQLEVLGAVEVIRTQTGLVRRNRYVVHQTPPRTHTGPRSMADWYGSNRAPRDESKAEMKQREKEFDAWLAAVRVALKQECARVAAERAAARKAGEPEPPLRPFIAPKIADFRSAPEAPAEPSTRTPKNGGTARPAAMRKTAGRAVPPKTGVRTPKNGGPVPPFLGDEQDQEEQDQSLSPAPRASAAPARGARARTEREMTAAPQEPTPTTAAAAGAGVAARVRPPRTSAAAAVELPVQRDGRESSEQARQVLAAYEEALGGPALPSVRAKVLGQAAELLEARPLWWLIDRSRELPQWGSDLRIHCEKSKVPFSRAAVPQGPENPCPDHPRLEAAGCPQCAADDAVDRQRRALDAERGIDDASALQALASLIQQAKTPRTPDERKREAAARQAAEARRQSVQRAEYLAR